MRTYWVLAASATIARALVALNVPAASNARDDKAFDCLEDDTRMPPADIICCDNGEPIAVTIRNQHGE